MGKPLSHAASRAAGKLTLSATIVTWLGVSLAVALTNACAPSASVDDALVLPYREVDLRDIAPARLRPQWQVIQPQTEEARRLTASPALDDEHVYAVYEDLLEAHRAADGSIAWRAYFDSPIAVAPVIVGGRIAVANATHWIWLLPHNGAVTDRMELWGTPVDAIAIDDELGLADSAGVARLAPGDLRWRRDLVGVSAIESTPDGTRLFATAAPASLHALDTADGRLLWESHETLGGSRIAVTDRWIYGVGTDRRLHSLDIQDGRSRWRTQELGIEVRGAPAILNNIVWVAGLDALLYGFDSSGGSELFKLPLAARNYLDLVGWKDWLVVSPHYGPWTLVRSPRRQPSSLSPGGVPLNYTIASLGELRLAPAAGAMGVALADSAGQLLLLTPEPRPDDATTRPPENSTAP